MDQNILTNLEQQAAHLDALLPHLTDEGARREAELSRQELSVQIMRLRNASMFASIFAAGGAP